MLYFIKETLIIWPFPWYLYDFC